MPRGSRNTLLLCFAVVAFAIALCFAFLMRRGFRATSEPSYLERVIARSVRDFAIPNRSRREKNPLPPSAENLKTGRELFLARCANCHGVDGNGVTPTGRGLYPRVPDLHSPATQKLTDGELHYIIENGVQLTGMPAWGMPHQPNDDLWQLVFFIRNLRPLSTQEQMVQQ